MRSKLPGDNLPKPSEVAVQIVGGTEGERLRKVPGHVCKTAATASPVSNVMRPFGDCAIAGEECSPSPAYGRRKFLSHAAGLIAASLVGSGSATGRGEEPGSEKTAGKAAPKATTGKTSEKVADKKTGDHALPETRVRRREEAYKMRLDAALSEKEQPLEFHVGNGDEALFPDRIANYSKGLPHNEYGEVDRNAYQQYLDALSTGDSEAFGAIPMVGKLKLSDPRAAYAFDLEGADSHRLSTAPPPTFDSAWQAGEMVEAYWHALMRDVPFDEYESSSLAAEAAKDLSALSNFRGPKIDGKVTPASLFRGDTPGDLAGLYISQFLWRDVPYGGTSLAQRYRTTVKNDDHVTDYAVWLKIQNGMPPTTANRIDTKPRYIRNGRDLGEFVHRDFTFQTYLNAALILLDLGPAAADPANPYRGSLTQEGFITFGAAHLLDQVARVAIAALRATWCQKWLVHRRLRPEVFAARIHNRVAGMGTYPIHSDVFHSEGAAKVFGKFGSYLLPLAYPEGSPLHPSYPAGHPAIAGACVTVLKAFFKESFVLPTPVKPISDGLVLVQHVGPPLTVGGELNKLAANIGIGRNFAGVHWRSDVPESLRLGEAVAIAILGNVKATCGLKDFQGFSLTKFDGSKVTVGLR